MSEERTTQKLPNEVEQEKYEKSVEQAQYLQMINQWMPVIDIEHLREAGHDMITQASRQESMAVLNPSYSQTKNKILNLQGAALMQLTEYFRLLKEVQELQKSLGAEEKQREEINKLFV